MAAARLVAAKVKRRVGRMARTRPRRLAAALRENLRDEGAGAESARQPDGPTGAMRDRRSRRHSRTAPGMQKRQRRRAPSSLAAKAARRPPFEPCLVFAARRLGPIFARTSA